MRRVTLAVLAVLMLSGCSGSRTANNTNSNSNNPPASATMQTGQWEFVATPSNSSQPVYLELNLSGSNANIFSTVFNTALFQFGGSVGGQFADCVNYVTSNQVGTSDSFSGTLSSPGSTPPENQATYTATLAANGQSVSNGTYSAPASGLCGLANNSSTGSLTGYTVSPLNGTFTGTLTGSSAGPDQISIQIAQDGNFGITASGTSLQAGVSTTLSITPDGTSTDNTGGYSNIIGATIQANGTTSNVNGNGTFQVFGHFNPQATQVQIVVTNTQESGTLTKQ